VVATAASSRATAADAVVLLFDLGIGWTAADQGLLDQVPGGAGVLIAGNKADAAGVPAGLLDPAALGAAGPGGTQPVVCCSALLGAGTELLVQELLCRCGATDSQGLQLALNNRQSDLAAAAAASLGRALEAAAQQLPWDFWTIDLRAAVRALGEITGEEVSEAVLDRVFSRFCIGK
jgi:tRNA modification GTPase